MTASASAVVLGVKLSGRQLAMFNVMRSPLRSTDVTSALKR
jgi:hypothetical protein